MAKGRKLTSSLSELFLGSYGHDRAAVHGHHNSGDDSPELCEEDVWSMIDGAAHKEDERRRVKGSFGGEWAPRAAVESGAREEQHLAGGLSLAFLGSYGHGRAAVHGHHNSGDDSPELCEEDVWSMIDGAAHKEDERRRVKGSFGGEWEPRSTVESGAREEPHLAGGLSLAFECHASPPPRILHQLHHREAPRGGKEMATSAPVKVPVWSEIYRADLVEWWNESEVVPPHVYLARGRRTGATSVFEGVGRTLKGRDLRRVRDAVWSQTGFDG